MVCKGFCVVIYNCIVLCIDEVIVGYGNEGMFLFFYDLVNFVVSFECLCCVVMMVKVGCGIDVVIKEIIFFF